jgi:UDP-N-acetylglucosamine diphosphorylase / glucose-1-phosphate thymidylyltransferase / UDP-N-acetylgalactosamine diphosphorylase / glucosamine-1-phosphate N-acetyltransferase / galactosamine-1-phosphate N-acetyltransferase
VAHWDSQQSKERFVNTTYIRHAVVLAAGKGSRMGSITDEIPKPMLLVQGKPMLEHILERLRAAGIENFFVVVGYRHQVIEHYFRAWQSPQTPGHEALKLDFRVQDPVNGTGSATRLAKDFVGDHSFLLTYADVLCDPQEYLRCGAVLHENPNAAAVLAVKAVDDPWRGAAVYEDQGRIRSIIEKPSKGSSTTHWNSAGFYSFRPILFQYLDRLQPSPRNEYELTSALDRMLEDSLELRISPIEGDWRDVGRPEDLLAVNAG